MSSLDFVFGAVWLANTAVVLVLACIGWSKDLHLPMWLASATDAETMSAEAHLIFSAAGISFGGSLATLIVSYVLLYLVPAFLLICGQLVLVASLVGCGVWLLMEAPELTGDNDSTTTWLRVAAAGCFLVATISLLWLFCIRDRIAFTAALVKSVAMVIFKLPELLLYQFLFTGIAIVYVVLWLTAALYYNTMLEGGCDTDSGDSVVCTHLSSTGTAITVNIWGLFSLFWGVLVIIYIAHVTCCGAVGAWYFSPETTGSRGCFLCRPSVNGALMRALTINFGSIAFGAFLIAVVQTIISILQYIAEQAGRNAVLRFACCCIVCLLQCIKSVLEWLTEYAFVYIAVYATPFITSGAKVAGLLGQTGIGAIAQQSLISAMLYLFNLIGIVVGACFGYLALDSSASYSEYDHVGVFACVSGATMGYTIMHIGLKPIDAGAKTLFVCYAEEPSFMEKAAPELSQTLGERMPASSHSSADEANAGLMRP